MLCAKCYGSGTILGLGMIHEDCDCDNGVKHEPVQVDKKSKAYREAIARIMTTSKVSREVAAKMFDDEYDKIA